MRIIIYTGQGLETWGPQSIVTGIGGSENAAIYMALGLASLGHEVEVVGSVTPYLYLLNVGPGSVRYSTFFTKNHCDVFVSSRNLKGIDDFVGDRVEMGTPKGFPNPPAELRCRQSRQASHATVSILWLHDIHAGDDWQDHLSRYDAIFCLSNWSCRQAKCLYSHVPEEKFVVTRNGIDPIRFLQPGEEAGIRPVKKTGCKIIYSSSPDRGLWRLLSYWPQIRKMRPDAELHVYYGFKNWEKILDSLKRDSTQEVARQHMTIIRDMLSVTKNDGVRFHDRVGQLELATAFMEARFWLYPTQWLETSCITAMEAQAGSAYPITTRLGALPETLTCGHLVDQTNPFGDSYESDFLNAFQWALDHEKEVRDAMFDARMHALTNLSWMRVAQEWDRMFHEMVSRKG